MGSVDRICANCGHVEAHHYHLTSNVRLDACAIQGCDCTGFADERWCKDPECNGRCEGDSPVKPVKVVSLIDSELKALMERYLAGDWRHEPDGGACHAIKLAYHLGRKEMSEEQAALCLEWHFHIADLQVAHEREMAILQEQTNQLHIALMAESDSHRETAEIMRRVRDHRDRLKEQLNQILDD